MRFSPLVVLLAFLIIAIAWIIYQYFFFTSTYYRGVILDKKGNVKATLRIRIASNTLSRALGFMVGEGDGILFLFENKGPHSFWMKNVGFPIYALSLERNKIVKLTLMEPCDKTCPTYPIEGERVLEVRKEVVEKHNIREGDYFFLEEDFSAS